MADTYTANYNLVKIEQGSTGWAGKANGNMDTIDGVVFLKIGYDAFNNVGIGTLTPSTKLHVVSSINQGIMVSDGTTIGIMFPSSTLTNSLAIGTQSNHPLLFGTNNVFPRMIIDTLGNVGIGTSTPSSVLHIKQSFSGDLGIIFEGNTKIWGFLNKTDGSFSLKDFITDTDRDLIDVVSGDRSFHKVNGSEIMRIANSGNVGIGTQSPSGLLHVSKNNAGSTVELALTNSNGTSNTNNSVTLYLDSTGSLNNSSKIVATHSSGTSGDHAQDLVFYTVTSGSVPTEHMRIKNNGDVTVTGNLKIGNGTSTTDGTVRWTGTDWEGRKGGAWVSLTKSVVPVNTQTGTTYTFALTDAGKLVTFGSGSATTVTIDTFANVAFPTGTQIDCAQLGAGKVTFAGAGGVTINSKGGNKAIGAQYVGVTLIKTDTNVWLLLGDLIA